MISLKRSIIIVLFLGQLDMASTAQFSQDAQRQIDSLDQIIKEDKYDTSVCLAYVYLSELLYVADIDTLKRLSEFAKNIV